MVLSPTKNNYLATLKITDTVNLSQLFEVQKLLRYHIVNRNFNLLRNSVNSSIGQDTVILFLVRSLLFRLELDYFLLTVAVNFLCREIHFMATNNGVVIVGAIVLVWIFYWRDRIWENIENAKLVPIALVGTAFTYS